MLRARFARQPRPCYHLAIPLLHLATPCYTLLHLAIPFQYLATACNTLLSNYLTTLLLYYLTTLLPYYPTTLLPYYLTSSPPYHLATLSLALSCSPLLSLALPCHPLPSLAAYLATSLATGVRGGDEYLLLPAIPYYLPYLTKVSAATTSISEALTLTTPRSTKVLATYY